jgi:PAS domain S-box-containing protein
MSLQDLKKHESASKTVALSSRVVSAFIQSRLILLQGNWQWDLHADAVFCSDVMVSYPPDFEGTSGIIHPEDLPLLKEKLFVANANPERLVFRIITTYGEVKTLEGHNIFIRLEEGYDQPMETRRQESLQLKWQKEYTNLQLLKEIYEKNERYWATGIWYYNLLTNVTWYSDEVYRIHGLPPQSLNAHLNTFNAFIHPEDKEAVQEFWARAFKQKVPLHIEYRIQTPGGKKHVSCLTQWFFSPKGETIVSGTVQDITAQKQLQLQIEEAIKAASFYKQQTIFDEQNALLGHWQVNLLTRKTVFSDNYYRIHGLKPQSLVAGIDAFLNYVHMDDREALSLAYKKMLQQQEPPKVDYRIMRTDGKLHYLSLKAKRIKYGNEVIIAGTIQDITMQKVLEKKAAELIKKDHIHGFAQKQTDELAGTASWVKEAGNDVVTWSESFYAFLGYKFNTVELSIKLLVSLIHPDDKQHFTSQLEMAEHQKENRTFTFRLVQRGSLRYIKAFFSTRYHGETEYFTGALHDVSREQRLRKQLQNQAQLTDALSANALGCILVTDSSNNILLWNQQCEEFYKIKKEDALGRNFFDIFPWQKTEEEMIFFNRALNGEKINLQEVKSSTGKGYFNLSMLPVWDEESGEVRGIVHIIHDVTKELELRKSMNERLNFISNLLEASVDRVIALDSNMNYLYWNKRAEEYYGLKSNEVVGKNILEIFPAFINDPSYAQFRQVLRGQTIHIPIHERSHNDNEHFETYLIPVKDEKEQVSAVLWIAHDLSPEYKLTKERKETLELLKATMDSSIDMIQVFEAVRNEAGEIIDFRWILNNHRSEKYYGDVIGKSLLQLNPGVVEAGIFDTFKRVVETGISDQSERHYAYEQFNGWFYRSVVKLNDGVATTTTDITDRKKAEQELTASRQLVQTVFDVSLNPIVYHKAVRDDLGKIVDFEFQLQNREARKYAMKDCTGIKYSEAYPGIKDSEVFRLYCDVVETGKKLNTEIQLGLKDINRWFQLMAVKLGDGLVATALDITERKKTEQETKESKELLESILYTLPKGLTVFEAVRDEQGYLVDLRYVLRNGYVIKGDEVDTLKGRLQTEAHPGTVSAGIHEKLKQVVATGINADFEVHYQYEGMNAWLRVMATKLRDGVIAFTEDITESKENEQEILRLKDEVAQRATDKYYSIFNSIDEGFCIYELIYDDNDKPVDLRWVEVNPAYEKQTGLTDILGKSHGELSLVTEKYWLEIYDKVVKTGESIRFENWHEPTQRWYHTFASRIGEAGSKQVAVVFEDITERKRREKQQEFLLKFSDALRTLPGQKAIEETGLRMLAEFLKLDRAYVFVLYPIEDRAVVRAEHRKESLVSILGEVRMSDFPETVRQIEDETIVFNDIDSDFRLSDLNRTSLHAVNLQAFVCASVRKGERNVIWSLAAATVTPRVWTKAEVELIELVAERIWSAAERANTEEALRESEEKLRHFNTRLEQEIEERTKKLQEQVTLLRYTEYLAQSGTWEYEVATGDFKWSEGMYKIFGLPQQRKVHPETYLDFVVEEDRSVAKKIINHFKKKPAPFEEIMRITRDNETRTLRVKGSVVHDDKGKAQKIIGVDVDVTDVVKAEEQLKESRHWLEQTAKASPDSITIYDLQNRQPVYLNSCLAEWTGISDKELVDMGIDKRLEMVHPDDRLDLLHHNEEIAAAKDGELLTMEYRIVATGGKIIWLRNRSKPFLRDASGKVTHMLSILQNVTEEVELREKLKQRTQFAEGILDANIDRMFVYDKSFTILAWNKRSEEVLGVKKEQAVGKSLQELFPKLWTDEVLLNAFHKALTGEFVYLPAKRAIYANGYFERFYVPLKNSEGETYAVLGIIHDVSEMVFHSEELKELNKTLERKNKELEEKNEEISSFAFIASHDLKEPLRKLYTFSDWLLQRETEGLSDTGKNYVKKIANSVKRMDMLIEDILILTKIDADKKAPSTIDLNAILDAVIGEMKQYIKQSGTEIIAEQLPVIIANDNQIFYLFKNLLSNAIKFQAPGSQPVVKIKAEQIASSEIDSEKALEATDYFRVSFTDNGLGFEAKYAKKIFQVFQRLHGNKEFEGTGMGLAICRKIMENHDGFIAVESEPGLGSVFSCYFPVL